MLTRIPAALLALVIVSCGSRTIEKSTNPAGGTGGSGGGTADAGACGCVEKHIEWGLTGGFVPFNDVSSLDACAVFLHRRPTKPPMASCTQDIVECTGLVSPRELTAAMADPDVQAAIAAAPILYGGDSRPSDGQVFTMQLGDATVEVGSPCENFPDCRPIPGGVQQLATLLGTMTKQQLSREPCKSQFPAQ